MEQRVDVAEAWESLAEADHLGGVEATHRLLKYCYLQPGQRVLDIGCGEGHTARLLAQEYGLRVVAADIDDCALKHTRQQVDRAGVGDRVTVVRADIQALRFPANTFDAVIAESVLAFCDRQRAAAEVYRVLKPGGVFGDSESTLLRTPPPGWNTLIAPRIPGSALYPLTAEKWYAVFEAAGFRDIFALISRPCPSDHAHRGFVRAATSREDDADLLDGLNLSGRRAASLNRAMPRARREVSDAVGDIGCGLYFGHKPKRRSR